MMGLHNYCIVKTCPKWEGSLPVEVLNRLVKIKSAIF
jgi:hypothetical protein